MDKTTLQDPSVTSALHGYVKIKFQAEQPDTQPAKCVMQRFGAVGLPAYVIVRPAQGFVRMESGQPTLGGGTR